MPAAFAAAGTPAFSSTATVVANFDGAAAAGDLVICVVNSALSTLTMPSVPTDWTDTVGRVVPTDSAVWVLWKIVAADTSVSVTLSGAAGTEALAAQVFRYTGTDTTNPIAAVQSVPHSNTNPMTSAAVTPTADGQTLAFIVTADLAVDYDEGASGNFYSGLTAGMTQRASTVGFGADFLNIMLADGAGPTPAASVTKAVTGAVADTSALFLLAIADAGGPPQIILPDADTTTTGWTTTPLFSKINDSSDATVISSTAA